MHNDQVISSIYFILVVYTRKRNCFFSSQPVKRTTSTAMSIDLISPPALHSKKPGIQNAPAYKKNTTGKEPDGFYTRAGKRRSVMCITGKFYRGAHVKFIGGLKAPSGRNVRSSKAICITEPRRGGM